MIKYSYAFLLFSLTLTCVQAQYQKNILQFEKAATSSPKQMLSDWQPILQSMEMPKPGTESARGRLLQLKESLEARYPRNEKYKTSSAKANISAPEVIRDFEGNAYMNRFPNDNDLAINNDGQLVSVINSSFYIFDTNADTLQLSISFDAFAESLALPDSKYDPRVIYDPNNDRFVAVILNGFLDSTSQIIVAFTATNDATGLWNLYALPGNPQNNGTWSDYPTIGISGSELFIGVNTFTNGSTNNTGFTEAVFWQVNLANGYNGETLNTAYYADIMPPDLKPVFNICPVRGGFQIAGDEMYLLSNRNLSADNDSIFLLKVSGQIPDAVLSLQILKAEARYFLPPRARQAFNRTFDTNDSRILYAFKQNGKIQFVQSCLDTVSGNAAVYHGIINNYSTNPQVYANILSDTLDLGFPGITYVGYGPDDDRAIINVNHTSRFVFSGCSVYSFDGISNYSERVVIKDGLNYVQLLLGNYQRWGDYTGIQRKYNEPDVVWIAGSYGRQNRTNGTWIGEVRWNDDSFLNTEEPASKGSISMVYPNPHQDEVNVRFSIDQGDVLSFSIYNLEGKLVKRLMREFAKKGENQFSFSTQPLTNGVYILKIESKEKLIYSEKIIKQ